MRTGRGRGGTWWRAVVWWLALALVLGPAVPREAGAAAAPGSEEAAAQPALDLTAVSAVLMDAGSGRILYEKNPDERRSPASITKVMTLVLAFEALHEGRIQRDQQVVVSDAAAALGGTQMYLEPGERVSVEDLLLATAVASANDGSVALAEHIAGGEEAFVQMMNEKAAALGMTNTHFANAHGLDADGHYTTARDLAVLSRHAATVPELLKYTAMFIRDIPRPNARGRDKVFQAVNVNRLVRFYPGADGLKTGHTDQAKWGVAATAMREDTRMIAVVLGSTSSADRFADATKLLNFGFARYISVPVFKKGQVVRAVRVHRGTREQVEAVAGEDYAVTVPRGQERRVERRLDLPEAVAAPLRRGQRVGAATVLVDGEVVGTVAIVAGEDVTALGFVRYLFRLVRFAYRGG